MKSAMRISLRNGERVYINGAVLRVDRKVGIELMNDVTFLLENQVMQAADATTPLRQLYFIVQMMLMNPAEARRTMALFGQHMEALRAVIENPELLEGLSAIERLVGSRRPYEALKVLRSLYAVEGAILDLARPDRPIAAA